MLTIPVRTVTASLPTQSSAVASSSSASTGVFSTQLASGTNGIGQYNNDIAAMSAQNQAMLREAMQRGQGNLLAGAGLNPAAYNGDIAAMTQQNAEMMRVQMAMQRENTMFTSISNVLKTKHDTAKNAISNIR